MGYKLHELPPHIQMMVLNAGHPAPTAFQPKGTMPNKIKGVQNASEKDFYVSYISPRELSGEFSNVAYEGVTFPIAHRCTYTPDFYVHDATGPICFEVKAPHRFKEKGVLKTKFAAQSFKHIRFFLCEKKKGQWEVKRIPAMITNSVSPEPQEDE